MIILSPQLTIRGYQVPQGEETVVMTNLGKFQWTVSKKSYRYVHLSYLSFIDSSSLVDFFVC